MFDTLTTGQFIFISAILVVSLYSSVRLRSLVSMASFTFLIISLVGVLEFELDLLYFWFMTILMSISLVVSMGAKASYQT